MRRNNKRLIKNKSNDKRGVEGFGFRNRVGNKIPRLEKKVKYIVEKSIEPDDRGDYVVRIESETPHGFSYGIKYKGKRKDCIEYKRCLENV